MGANIGTTLGNGLIALPLGPLGLLSGGFFGLIHVFSKNERVRSISLTCMGFALIFFGLNLLTGGLRPLRSMPQVMAAITGLHAENLVGVISCILTAALITAMIHSSSATIGIVMGLGASGVLGWKTAVAFSLGADLGTTITSWMASLNLTKNAKRAAYAHIAFNIIGVLVMLPLFFPSMALLAWAMRWFGGDPGTPVVRGGVETFPLVPVAVGVYSIGFNIFNTVLMFPFVGALERVLSRIGREAADDAEDYSIPQLPRSARGSYGAFDRHTDNAQGNGALRERRRPVSLNRARGKVGPQRRTDASCRNRHPRPRDPPIHGGDVPARHFAARGRPAGQPDRRNGFHRQSGRNPVPGRSPRRAPAVLPVGREFVDATLAQIAKAMHEITPADGGSKADVTKPEAVRAVSAGYAPTLPGGGQESAVGGARPDSRAPWQCRASLFPDQSD